MKIHILDGGIGFELNKTYSDFGKTALESDTRLIEQIYEGFISMGCEYITTCNYGCRPNLDTNWISNSQVAINIVQKYREKVLVCGSIPPFLQSYTAYPISDGFVEYYKILVQMMKNKVDIFLIETCCSIKHAVEIVEIIKSIIENPIVYVSFYPTYLNSQYIQSYCDLDVKGLFINCCSFETMKSFYLKYLLNNESFKTKTFGFYCNKIDEKNYTLNPNMKTLKYMITNNNITQANLVEFLKLIKQEDVIIGGCCGYGLHEMNKLIHCIKEC